MKVTVNQVSEGLASYIDHELVPKVPGIRKWVLGVAGAYAGSMVVEKIKEHKDLLTSLGIMTEDGMVDIDKVMPYMKTMANQSGPVSEHFPMIGDVRFDASDVDKLYSYIIG